MNTTLRDATTEDFRKKAKVLEPGETRRQKLWDECVAAAKMLVKRRDEQRFEIVDLANKCCVVHYGGKYANERYTVKRFAEEIGLTPQTLLEWMRLKKNIYDNLRPEQRETFSLTTLAFIDRNLKGIKKDHSFGRHVRAEYRKLEQMHPSTIKMTKYLKQLRSVHFNVKNPRMIANCDSEVLIEILHLSREIAFCLREIDHAPAKVKIKKAATA